MSRLRIAFLWDGIEKAGATWQDGLWLAMKRLEARHTIRYVEPRNGVEITEWKTDVIIFWGALSETIVSQVIEYPFKKVICFAGGAIEAGNVEGWDLFFVESEISEIELTVLGKPVLFANDMPAVAVDALAIAYGDFGRGYTIVDRMGIRVLRDPFTDKQFVKFYTTKRVGGAVTNYQSIKLQKLEA